LLLSYKNSDTTTVSWRDNKTESSCAVVEWREETKHFQLNEEDILGYYYYECGDIDDQYL
jgi:hypothetical protein